MDIFGSVLAIKDGGTQQEVWKERFVVQRHLDRYKKMLVHDISVARQYSTNLLVGLASIFGSRLFCADVTEEYIKISEVFNR